MNAKHTLHRPLLALLLATSLLTGLLAACGGESGSQSTAFSSAASTEASQEAEGIAVPFDEPLEFTYFGSMWQPYSADQTDIIDEIQRVTNTKIDFQWTASDTFADKLAAMLASGNLPEIINTGDTAMLVSQEAIIPLDDLIQQYAPNYQAALGEGFGPYTKFSADGKTYSFKCIFDYPPLETFMVRRDWIERVGMEMPTDWDGWVDLWKAFRDQDANGDGNAGNEIPYADYATLRNLHYICGIQVTGSVQDNNTMGLFALDDSGNYSIVSEHPNYELFLDTARMLYEEKLLDQEYQTRKGNTDLFSIMDNNTLGTTAVAAERAKLSTQVNAELTEGAYWSSIVPVVGPNGDQLINARAKFSGNTFITVAAEEKGMTEQLTAWLDWFYGEEGVTLVNYGIEGTHYDVVDGKPLLREPYINGFLDARQAGLINQTMPLFWQGDNYQMILLQGKGYDDLDDAGKTFVDGLTVNDAYYFAAAPTFSTEAFVEKGVDLMDKLSMARDNYITGKITKDQYKTEYDTLKAAGLDEIDAQAKAAYAAVQ